jgi:hypothetical protein
MHPFARLNKVGSELGYICEKCHSRYVPVSSVNRTQEFMGIINEITSLYKRDMISEEAYRELIRYMISIYVQAEIEWGVVNRVDKTLCEKLTPHNFLGAFV